MMAIAGCSTTLAAVGMWESCEHVMTEDAHFVIDKGSASFMPLSRYLVEGDIAGLVEDGGKRPWDPAMLDSGKALVAVVEQFPPSVALVAWINEFFGPIVTKTGEVFERTPLYQQKPAPYLRPRAVERLSHDTSGRTWEICFLGRSHLLWRTDHRLSATVPSTDCSQSSACLNRAPGPPPLSGLNMSLTAGISRGGRRVQACDISADAGDDRSRNPLYAVMRGHR